MQQLLLRPFLCSIDPGYVSGGISFLREDEPGRLSYAASYPFQMASRTDLSLREIRKERTTLLTAETKALVGMLQDFEPFWAYVDVLVLEENDIACTRDVAPIVACWMFCKHPHVRVFSVLPVVVSRWLSAQTNTKFRNRAHKKQCTGEWIHRYDDTIPYSLTYDQDDSIMNGVYLFQRLRRETGLLGPALARDDE